MFLNALLQESMEDSENFVEIMYSGGSRYGRVADTNLDGEMFGFCLEPNSDLIYIAKSSVMSFRFVAKSDLPGPLDGGPEIPEEE